MIVKLAIDVPLYQLFDYEWDKTKLAIEPQKGQIVKVEFGKKEVTGIVLQIYENNSCSSDQIKTIKSVLEISPFKEIDESLIRLCQFAAKYYLRPLGEILFSTMPSDWKKPEKWPLVEKQIQKYLLKESNKNTEKNAKTWNLNPDQEFALEELNKLNIAKTFNTALLKGVTGSGKTAVYLEWLKNILKEPKSQCLIMVPEINLTPQLEKIIQDVFVIEDISVLHSNITTAKRNIAWWKIQNGLSRVIVGTRLSIFVPIPNLKAIVIDEEHDYSYKQQDGLRYQARDLAISRAAICKIPILLTSATPSSETWQKVQQNKMKLLTLSTKAKAGAETAQIHLVDIAKARKEKNIDEVGISSEIKEVIRKTSKANKQTLIFINRRGYSPILHCSSCDWKSECKSCSAWMVVHKNNAPGKPYHLQCHHCGKNSIAPRACPECGNQDLTAIGIGTQRVEEHLQTIFPEIDLIRVDSDSTKSKTKTKQMFEKIHEGKPCLVVGTQMISKGHDFQHIQTVIVLDVDKSLYSQDFRAIERIFSQLVQVSGRSGRSSDVETPKVYIQTEFVDHPLFKALANHHYDEFFSDILRERLESNLPPYTHQALIIVESKTTQKNKEVLREIKEYLESLQNKNTEIYDPVPRTLHRISGVERDQILIESKDRVDLQEILEKALDLIETIKKESRSIKILIDRDPFQY